MTTTPHQNKVEKKKERPVLVLIKTGQAIDYTKVYTFRVTKTLQPGDIIEWDTESAELKKQYD